MKLDKFIKLNPELLLPTGLENALVGIGKRYGQPELIPILDVQKIEEIQIRRGMTLREAYTYVEVLINTIDDECNPLYIIQKID